MVLLYQFITRQLQYTDVRNYLATKVKSFLTMNKQDIP